MSVKKQPQRWVLITSGAKRLGLAFTKEACELGYCVCIHYRRTLSPARRWLKSHPQYRDCVRFFRADLTDPHNDLIGEIERQGMRLSGLVNNASLYSKGNFTNLEHYASITDTNAGAALRLSERFRQHTRKGWIVNITDARIAPFSAVYQNYRVSKLLLEEITRQSAMLYAPGIRVNAIAPGAMLPASGGGRADFARLAAVIPLRRTGDMRSLRMALRYCIENRYVTGQVLYVDGGWHLGKAEQAGQ